MAGKFVISLDFELMWGVRDHRNVAEYGDAVLGVRTALPETLARFKSHGIRATWATVGLLFCRTRDEMHDFTPKVQPGWQRPEVSPYYAVQNEVGKDEANDPYHFGRSLLDQVADTEGQEIATHTFGHFCCLEEGHTPTSFQADLQAAVAIAAEAGHKMTSIVFPRNQFSDAHIDICQSNGIDCIRGNPSGFAYRPRNGKENTLLVRGVRLMDGALPITGSKSYTKTRLGSAPTDVPASRFLRPWWPRREMYSKLHVRRVRQEMRTAAQRGEIYHLWWHPHNMGRDIGQNLAQLDAVLNEYRNLHDTYGMQSANMQDLKAIAA